jgi:hypothetical protein
MWALCARWTGAQGPRGVSPNRPPTTLVPLLASDAFYPFLIPYKDDQEFLRSLLAVLFLIALPALVLVAACWPKVWRR